jgi:predicted component of type VI protein secretion system
MVKLQVLSGSLAGQSHELKVDETTVGRLEDNSFQLADPSVSSHHCKILFKGDEVVVKDLNSTNGIFIDGNRITEGVLKPGQVLRLGQVELRIDDGSPLPPAPAPSAAMPAPAAVSKTRQDQTIAVQRGITLNELAEPKTSGGLDTATIGFTKKTDKVNRYFLIGGIILGSVIFILLAVAFWKAIKAV